MDVAELLLAFTVELLFLRTVETLERSLNGRTLFFDVLSANGAGFWTISTRDDEELKLLLLNGTISLENELPDELYSLLSSEHSDKYKLLSVENSKLVSLLASDNDFRYHQQIF